MRTCELNFRGVADIDADAILEPQAEWARDWIRVHEDCGLGAVQRGVGKLAIADHVRAWRDDSAAAKNPDR